MTCRLPERPGTFPPVLLNASSEGGSFCTTVFEYPLIFPPTTFFASRISSPFLPLHCQQILREHLGWVGGGEMIKPENLSLWNFAQRMASGPGPVAWDGKDPEMDEYRQKNLYYPSRVDEEMSLRRN